MLRHVHTSLALALVAVVSLLCSAAAHAQEGPATSNSSLALFLPMVAMLCSAFGLWLRSKLPAEHWIDQVHGKAVLIVAGGLLGLVLTSVGQYLTSGPGLSAMGLAVVVAGALANGIATLLGASSPQASRTLLLLFGLGLAFTVSGCACWQPASSSYNSTPCVVLRQTVDCTTTAVEGQEAAAISIATALINQGVTEIPQLLAALQALGFQAGECILDDLAKDFGPSLTAIASEERPQVQKVFAANWYAYRSKLQHRIIHRIPAGV